MQIYDNVELESKKTLCCLHINYNLNGILAIKIIMFVNNEEN